MFRLFVSIAVIVVIVFALMDVAKSVNKTNARVHFAVEQATEYKAEPKDDWDF